MTNQEKEKEGQRLLEEIRKELCQLSPWDLYKVRLLVKWVKFRHRLRSIVWKWLLFQVALDEKIKALGKKG